MQMTLSGKHRSFMERVVGHFISIINSSHYLHRVTPVKSGSAIGNFDRTQRRQL
jgi:hypothetical protein